MIGLGYVMLLTKVNIMKKSYIVISRNYITNSYNTISHEDNRMMYFDSHDDAKCYAQANLDLYQNYEVIEFVVCDECGHRTFADNTFNVGIKILCDCCYYGE